MSASLEVVATGPLALVQDLGRPGRAHLGVGRSGAADRAAFRLGARLLAQRVTSAAIEVTFGGLVVRADGAVMVVLTGADAVAEVDGRGVGHQAPFTLRDGQVLRLGVPRDGVRTYLSVRGGIDVPAVLGSRATDTLSGLGPVPLRPGLRLPIGRPPRRYPQVDLAPAPMRSAEPVELRVTAGPRADWLADLATLDAMWVVSSQSDRVGVRLEGPALDRRPDLVGAELVSEGVVRGAIQLPPAGRPILFLADHPVTGGYPVVAVVEEADVDRAAQLAPGQSVRLRLLRH